jgi:hypothetical protein
MSLRDLLEYLSGKLPEGDGQQHGASFIRETFDSFREDGLSIQEIVIEDSDGDDNWITFKFTQAPDPSVSPFIVPQPENNHP